MGGKHHSQMVKEEVQGRVGTLQSISQSWAVPCVCLTSKLRMLFTFLKDHTKRRRSRERRRNRRRRRRRKRSRRRRRRRMKRSRRNRDHMWPTSLK